MKSKVTQTLNLLLLSLLLAFFFWAIATEGENPTQQRVFPGLLPIQVTGIAPGMMTYGSGNTTVRVTVRAPQSVWEALQSDDLHVFVDVSEITTGTHTLPIQVAVRRQPSQVVQVTPATVAITMEPIAEREIPVNVLLEGTPALGYVARSAVIAPQQVRIQGPASLVAQATRAQIAVSVDNKRQAVRADFQPIPVDEAGNSLPHLEVLPANVTVNIPIEQLSNFRDLAVKVEFTGQPAAGYRLADVTVEPPVVTVVGRTDIVQDAAGYLSTAPLDLTDLIRSFTTSMTLQIPEGLSVLLPPLVTVTVQIEPLQSSVTLNLQPEIRGLADNLTATVAPETIAVIISGPLPQLETLDPAAIRAILNLSGLTAGEHSLTPEIILPFEGVQVDSLVPRTVVVRLSRKLQGQMLLP